MLIVVLSFTFCSGIVSAFYFQEENVYKFASFAFGELSDHLTFSYKHYEPDKISIVAF